MKIISVLNQKGGVGKTTSTYNIAAAIAKTGAKVLMIDSDSQASLTLMTANNPLSFDTNVCNIYEDYKQIRECIYRTPVDNLDFIPSSLKLAKIETKLFAEGIGRESKMRKALSFVNEMYDYCIIDCPPSLSMITLNNLVASDELIIPTETSALSVYALDDLMETVDSVKEVNDKLKIKGIIATRFDKRTKHDNCSLDELKANHIILGVVKNTVEAKRGIDDGLPVVIANPSSDIAKEYNSIANKIMEVN